MSTEFYLAECAVCRWGGGLHPKGNRLWIRPPVPCGQRPPADALLHAAVRCTWTFWERGIRQSLRPLEPRGHFGNLVMKVVNSAMVMRLFKAIMVSACACVFISTPCCQARCPSRVSSVGWPHHTPQTSCIKSRRGISHWTGNLGRVFQTMPKSLSKVDNIVVTLLILLVWC